MIALCEISRTVYSQYSQFNDRRKQRMPHNAIPDDTDDNSFEGPDVETHSDDREPDGLGTDGTTASHPGAIVKQDT